MLSPASRASGSQLQGSFISWDSAPQFQGSFVSWDYAPNLRSRWQNKAWGASPRKASGSQLQGSFIVGLGAEPAKRAAE